MLRALGRPLAGAVIDARTRLANRIDPPVLVLLYHRVARLADDPDLLAVTPERFREQLRWLKGRLGFTRFEADWSATARPAIAVTFDDGYADNFHAALPILAELEIPATFFVTAGQVDAGEEFWWDELERCLAAPEPVPALLELPAGPRSDRLDMTTAAARAEARELIHRRLFDAPPAERRELIAALRTWSGSSGAARESHRALAAGELARLAEHPLVTIGAHTVSHARLAALDLTAQRREILDAKSRLESLTGRPIEVFAYPFGGRRDYTPATTAICREVGFRKAAANFPANAHRWSDPLQIPRHLIRNWDVAEFSRRIGNLLAR